MPQSTKQPYDAIVAGAGPAGLLLASKIAHNRRVLLFDRSALGATQKFWLTSYARLRQHGLESATAFRASRGSIGSFLGGYAPADGDFAVVDDRKLLLTLLDRCRSAGVHLVERAHLQSLRWEQTRLVVQTSLAEWRCRLLIDATGGGSPIAATFRQHRLAGFFSVFGAHLRGIKLLTNEIIGAYVLRLGFPTPMFEVFPTGNDSAFAVVFFASRRLQAIETMRSVFDEHLRNNPFFQFDHRATHVDGKMGGIPIGYFVRRRLPGVFSYGEAGMVQSPLIGGAFNEVLRYVDAVAERVGDALANTGGRIVELSHPLPWRKRWNDWLQYLLVRPLLGGSLEEYERLVRLLEAVGPRVSYRLFGSELASTDVLSLASALVHTRLSKLRPRHMFPHQFPLCQHA